MAEHPASPRSSIGPPTSDPALIPTSDANDASRPSLAPEFFIQPPTLSPAKKGTYMPLNTLYENIIPTEAVGECRYGGELFYFAKRDEGMVYRFPASFFAKKFPEMLEEYNHKKDMGSLGPFDPSAPYVHPMARIILHPPRPPKESLASSGASSFATEDESSDDEDFKGGSGRKQPTRSGKAKPKELPFSPKKTRSRNIILVHGSDSEPESEGRVPTRRSSRKKTTRGLFQTEDADEDEEYRPAVKVKATKPRRVKTVPPQYGVIRSVSTIDDDPVSDDEDHAVLRAHRAGCEKCGRVPAHRLLAGLKKKGKGKRKRKGSEDDFDYSDEEELFTDLGGWVQCLKCPVSFHWGCINRVQQDEVLKAIRAQDSKKVEAGSVPSKPRKKLGTDDATEFICGPCSRGGSCMGCMEVVLEPRVDHVPDPDGDVDMGDAGKPAQSEAPGPSRELLFRCATCKRLSHYKHLRVPRTLESHGSLSAVDLAEYYQENDWTCYDCASFQYKPDKIIAWRPYPAEAKETLVSGKTPSWQSVLPREYLIKWERRSYRRLQWVPHMWLLATHPSKLRNFIEGGTKVQLLREPIDDTHNAMDIDVPDSGLGSLGDAPGDVLEVQDQKVDTALAPLVDAEKWIPPLWSTIDRVLTVLMRIPTPRTEKPKKKRKSRIISSDDEEQDELLDDDISRAFDHGEEPPKDKVITVEEWEAQTNREIGSEDIDGVVWGFFKWQDLGYEEATWDSPPRRGEKGFEAFEKAFQRFISSRSVKIPKRTKKENEVFDKRPPGASSKYLLKTGEDLSLGQAPNLSLLPFQVDGFNWLVQNWWNHQPCILADEMGLGKTVQIATFLGHIMGQMSAFPALVVVPNSTITNWVREFERWAPRLRVVPFYGDKESRDIIKKFELFHQEVPTGCLKSKFHVLVTTYETITSTKDAFPVFKNQARWEVLVIDEGQRLKNDDSLLFRKLNELNVVHRIIMTGTPLNNNIRELFNLMNFLDEDEWNDLDNLAKEYEELSEELIKGLHGRLRPYFLRRTKEVLDLPPKGEVIVPVSMAPVQKEVYRSILTRNLDILKGLSPGINLTISKGKLRNVLMELRKCLQHPYLSAEDIIPSGLDPEADQHKLIDASAKLRFLKMLLPKLKQQGHRVLLFSQFVIALNQIEEFLVGEGYKFLRLDGSTKSAERQKAMDNFNKPDSEYFIFLLTTRAGGVGINLFTADTVIIHDPDFNPQQDLQAIARSYRHGQKKTCLVFKLMVKDSAEERIMQMAKKKRILDHLIVQKINDQADADGEDFQSILMYGAQALFEGGDDRDINHTEQDIEKLIEKTKNEAVKETAKAGGGLAFAFAKVWEADKDTLNEMDAGETADSWSLAIQKMNEQREKEQAATLSTNTGRARRKAADLAKTKMQAGVTQEASLASIISPKKTKARGKGKAGGSDASDASDYRGPAAPSESSDSENDAVDDFGESPTRPPRPSIIAGSGFIHCGLCGRYHGPRECEMTLRSENLAEYRAMLFVNEGDESVEERQAAINAIDELLNKRGDLRLIEGQPLRLVSNMVRPDSKKIRSEAKTGVHGQSPNPKKPKQAETCYLCQESFHHLKECRVVKAGSSSINLQIRVLEARGDYTALAVVNSLRKILAKTVAREKKGEAS